MDMTTSEKVTLRLNMPQWQGGNEPGYYFGSQLLSFLAPPTSGPVETVSVTDPERSEQLTEEDGIVGRSALLAQAREARRVIEKHKPDRIVTLGGDCLVSLAPMSYLNSRYNGKLGVLWVDAHPDVMSPKDFSHAHAYVLGLLMGKSDQEFAAEADVPVDPSRVMYAGLDEWTPVEDGIIKELGLAHVGSAQITASSESILAWIKERDIEHVAIHFDLDVLDPSKFRPLLFNKPNLGPDELVGVPRGKLQPNDVVRLLNDVSATCDVVGLTIAEHLPWETMAMRDMLARLPLLAG